MSSSKKILIKENGSISEYTTIENANIQGKSDYLKILEYNLHCFPESHYIKFLDNEVKCERIKHFYESPEFYYIEVIPKIDFLEPVIEFDESPLNI